MGFAVLWLNPAPTESKNKPVLSAFGKRSYIFSFHLGCAQWDSGEAKGRLSGND